MIIEIRRRQGETVRRLILIPTPDEARIIEEVIGDKVFDDDGLICRIDGEYRIADGYGPAYITLHLKADNHDPCQGR